MTHNQYISLFTNIATAHNLVKSFGTGPIHEYLDTNTDTSKGINLWLEVDNSKISGSVITDRFTLYCMDYVNKDVSNRDEVLSDTKRTLEDVIALLHNQLYVDDFELEKSTDLNVFYDEKFANEACGWYCVISLKNDFVYDSCQIPLNGIPITAISYTVDVSSGFTLAVTATRTLTINGVTYDLSADRTWTIAAGGISGLTTNELVYGNSATTVASLPVATYPSLTELSYVKGVTSAIQTQLNAKASLTSPTFVTDITTPKIIGNGATTTGLTFVTSVTALGAVAQGVLQTPTLIAAANGDALYGLRIIPTFTLGAFTSTNSFGLGMTCGTAQIRMGNITGSTSIAGLYMTPNTPSTSNFALYYTTSQTRINQESTTVGSILFQFGGSTQLTLQSGGTSGGQTPFLHAPASSTGQTASTNLPTVKFTGRSLTKAVGADALQYFNYFATNTIAYASASTLTLGASLAVDYITRGANATITTSAAIYVPTSVLVSTTTAYGLYIATSSGATNNYGIGISAGTTTSAPILLTSGTNMTTAVAGAFEYDGTNLFFTRTGTTRESVICSNAVNSVSPTAQNRTITVVIAGTTYYLTAKTTND